LNRLNTAAFRALASPASRPPPFFADEPTEENALAFSCQISGQNHLLLGASSPSRTEKGNATQGGNKLSADRLGNTLMVLLVTLTISRFGGAGGELGISPSSSGGGGGFSSPSATLKVPR
jgi:hypothetical protein